MANALDEALDRPHDFFSEEFSHRCSITQTSSTHSIGESNKLKNISQVSSLPDELILDILLAIIRCFPAPLATITLASCSLVSHQWHRLSNPILCKSPLVNVVSKRRALHFLNRLTDEIIEFEQDFMTQITRELRPNLLINQMTKLMIFGEGRWKHRASFDLRTVLENRSTLHEILDRLWCTRIESLVFVELPFTTLFHQPLVNRYPTTLSTLLLLTPLSHFELLLILRNLPTLTRLCIGSHDDSSSIPAEHHTLFSREDLPSSNLHSFGIAARTLETWLRTGMPWYESILNLIVLPSVRSITTLHIELADEDDERHLLSILGRPPPSHQLQSTSVASTVSESSKNVGTLFKLENVFLRGFSSVLMAESLTRLEGIRKLCLSSIFATALRCPILPFLAQTDNVSIRMGSESTVIDSSQTQVIDYNVESLNPIGSINSRTLSTKNLVWQSIPHSIEELSIEITRLPDHGPWNKRSSDHLTRTLTYLIQSGQCPHLKKLGSLLAEPSFQFGVFGPYRNEYPVIDFLKVAASHGVSLVPSFWNDSFVIDPSGVDWYQ